MDTLPEAQEMSMGENDRDILLTFHDVDVELGDRLVLNGVSFELAEGEILAVVGPNGAGKTTLLRSALGLARASRGKILLGKDEVETLPPRARALRASWLPQAENTRENLTVGEFVALGRYPHLGSFTPEGEHDRAVVDEALEEADVMRFKDRGVMDLSGGERQRVLFARSLAQGSPLLLLDEPTNHLDMGYQLQVMQDLDRFRSVHRGRAVLVAIHDLNIASRFADRIMWLKEGRIEAIGTPLETMTSDRIFRLYGVDAEIHRTSGWAYVYPPRQRVASVQPASSGIRVHVVCGGGSGGGILRRLAHAGFVVTAGALPLLDSDQETSVTLNIPSVVEAPFTELSERAREENRALMEKSDAIVVAPLVVGPGNLANLTDVKQYAVDHPTFLVGGAPGKERDFANGAAGQAYASLVKSGAREVLEADLVTAVAEVTSALGKLRKPSP
jgi:iron complex transport system ATP-binding protein